MGGTSKSSAEIPLKTFDASLTDLQARGRKRFLSLPAGIDLSSNDYLGLSTHPALRAEALRALEDGIEIGAAGSRLLRGHRPAHDELEAFAASYFNVPKTLFFPNGFLANYAVITTLIGRNDLAIFDALCHASMRDGLFASRCDTLKVKHNDLCGFEAALKKPRKSGSHTFLMVESIYSMDGDQAPLSELLDLADRYDAILIVDEAHGTGVFGATGRGLAEGFSHDRLISIHTCGKALGVAGALVCAKASVIEYLITAARPFIYSTAPMPLQAVLVKRALELVREEPERRHHLHHLMAVVRKALPTLPVTSPIIPIVIGEDQATMAIAEGLQARGFDVRGIRPPTVPEGTARLRISLNAGLQEAQLVDFCATLSEILQDKGHSL